MLARARKTWRKIFGRAIDERSVFSLSKETPKGQKVNFK